MIKQSALFVTPKGNNSFKTLPFFKMIIVMSSTFDSKTEGHIKALLKTCCMTQSNFNNKSK